MMWSTKESMGLRAELMSEATGKLSKV